jgi:stress-induced morphogen
VEVVSARFEGKLPVVRHRMVYSLLDAEIGDGGVGLALFITTLYLCSQNTSTL